jgi:hypothetical protein
MALSPNYGFPEPDNASLVKNGAQDIRALGDAIDSFLFRPFGVNPLINSSFQIWQRGTSFAAPAVGAYVADRWNNGATAAGRTISRQNASLEGFQYCARVQRDSGETGVGATGISQTMETINSIPYQGKTVTLSFYARAGANYSAASSLLSIFVATGTGTDEKRVLGVGGFTGNVSSTATVTLTTSWQRFTRTVTLASNANEIAIGFDYTPVGTAGAADYFEVTGAQFEIGSIATPYKSYAGTIQGELSAAMRYYQRFGGQAAYQALGSAMSQTTTNVYGLFTLPVPMRVIPTSFDLSTLVYQQSDGGLFAITAGGFNTPGLQCVRLNLTTAGATANRPGQILTDNSTSGYVAFSAEL